MYKCLLFYLTWTEPRAQSQFRTMETVHTYIPVCAVWGPAVCLVALTQWEPLSFDRCFGARARRGAVRGPEHTDAWNKRCATAPLNKHPQQFLPNAASLSADFLSRRVQRCIRAELLNTWKFKCPMPWLKPFLGQMIYRPSLQFPAVTSKLVISPKRTWLLWSVMSYSTPHAQTQTLLPWLALGWYATDYARFGFTATHHT